MFDLGEVYESSYHTLALRVSDLVGNYLTQSTVASIRVQSYDDSATLIITDNPSVSDVVFNTLQTTNPTSLPDYLGYNLRYVITPDMIPDANQTYYIEILITASNSQTIKIGCKIRTTRFLGT